mmetsp:Transcript_54851/g.153858  ORF Transcript_54851/g.153858 Transcript_54851/m.153858 type:complete len:207 (+) Transcript_54851:178-798(+)
MDVSWVYSCRGEHALQLHRDIRAGAVHRWPQSLRLLRCPKLCLFHAVGVVDACSSCGGISHRPSLGLGVVREGELGGGHHGHDGLRLCRHRGRAAFSLDGVARRRARAGVEDERDLQRGSMGLARVKLDDDRCRFLLAFAEHHVLDGACVRASHVLPHEGIHQDGLAGLADHCEDLVVDRAVVLGMARSSAHGEALADRMAGEAGA